MNVTLIETADGSHTLYDPGLNETYHSRHGAKQESRYVYIQHGLNRILPAKNAVRILEVGFGTGLNIWLTLTEAMQHPAISFHVETIEPFPLPGDVIASLNLYAGQEHGELAGRLHGGAWNEVIAVLPHVHVIKHRSPVLRTPLPADFFDVIYFDAFAPDKQPDMWTPAVLKLMYRVLAGGGVLVTYCAKGQVKRDLRTSGFEVESLPGPPGKREMIRALKPA